LHGAPGVTHAFAKHVSPLPQHTAPHCDAVGQHTPAMHVPPGHTVPETHDCVWSIDASLPSLEEPSPDDPSPGATHMPAVQTWPLWQSLVEWQLPCGDALQAANARPDASARKRIVRTEHLATIVNETAADGRAADRLRYIDATSID
jgi:hypothetical protein